MTLDIRHQFEALSSIFEVFKFYYLRGLEVTFSRILGFLANFKAISVIFSRFFEESSKFNFEAYHHLGAQF